MRLIFAGSSAFGIPALEKLVEKDPPLLIISQPDKAAGRRLEPRPCPLAEYSSQQGLRLFQPEDVNSPESLDLIGNLAPELIITASYGGLLRRGLRKIPAWGAINLHPSLLPSYRGATPIQSALLKGEVKTGLTIFKLNSRLDAGPILAQEELPIAAEDNYSVLHDKLAELGAKMLLELLPRLKDGLVPAREQDESRATYTAKFNKEDLILDWDLTAVEVLNRIRAFSQVPGALTQIGDSPLKILAATITEDSPRGIPGSVGEIVKNTGFTVNCRDRQLLILRVQPSGKKVMDAWAYQLGARLRPCDQFSYPNNKLSPNSHREEQ